MRWTLHQTEELVRLAHGYGQGDLVKPVLQSTVDRLSYAKFHYFEARDLLQGYVEDHLAETPTMLLAMWGDDESRRTFNECMFKVGAHLHAGVNSIHSVGDIAAYAVYLSLGMNLKPDGNAADRKIYLSTVVSRLPLDPKAKEVLLLLKNLIDSSDLKHLRALSNLGKHQTIIKLGLNENHAEAGAARYSLTFARCQHAGQAYPPVHALAFLERSYNLCNQVVVDLGNALNRYLAPPC